MRAVRKPVRKTADPRKKPELERFGDPSRGKLVELIDWYRRRVNEDLEAHEEADRWTDVARAMAKLRVLRELREDIKR